MTNKIITVNFGEHLMIDGYFGDQDLLNSQDLVLELLNKLPDELGMKKLSEPVVYFAESNDKKDPGGWSGFVVIMESHISIHTFPRKGFVSADVYSCKDGLDTEFVINRFKGTFKLKEVEINLVKRGTRFPVENLY